MITVRPFGPADAARVSEIIRRCLHEVNAHDYPPEIIDRMTAHYTPARMIDLSRSREIFVTVDEAVVGTVSRDGNKVFSLFVDPDRAGQGIGRLLMNHIEAAAAAEGHDHMETGASITAHDFYRKRGYVDLRESETEFGLNYILRKPLSGPGAVSRSGGVCPGRAGC